jgi:hypothetical protein
MKVIKNKKIDPSVSSGKPDKRTEQEKASDSSTFVAQGMGFAYKGVAHVYADRPIGGQQELLKYCLSGVRKHTSFRCDGLLWKNFKEMCEREGLSTCHVVEKLLLGWLVGVETGRLPVVNVSVDMPRIVKRVRRRQLVFEDEISVSEEPAVSARAEPVGNGGLKCFICGGEAVGEAVHEDGKHVFVCGRHLEELRVHPKWKVTQ